MSNIVRHISGYDWYKFKKPHLWHRSIDRSMHRILRNQAGCTCNTDLIGESCVHVCCSLCTSHRTPCWIKSSDFECETEQLFMMIMMMFVILLMPGIIAGNYSTDRLMVFAESFMNCWGGILGYDDGFGDFDDDCDGAHGAWRQFLLDKNKQRFCFSQVVGFDVRILNV